MSRNSGRKNSATGLGTNKKATPTDPVTGTSGFSFATPTDHVDLPSGGKCYPEGHALHDKDSVEIKYMTAKEEDILTSQTLLKKGLAIERLLESVILDDSINPRDLLVGDRNAILVAARITGFGSDYETQVTCPSCLKGSVYTFDLDNVGIKASEPPEGVSETSSGTFIIELPTTGVTTEVKLLTGADEARILSLQESKKKHKLPESPLTDHLKTIIVSVDGHEDRSIINQFVENMPSRDTRYLRKQYDGLNPNIDMSFAFECPSCDTTTDVEVPFTISFLWPKQ